jgi:hypothetical protein
MHQTLADLAAHRAILLPHRCHLLPFLPPTTRNVKLSQAANPLEFGIREEITPDTTSKNGKNGNVDRASQHCHLTTHEGTHAPPHPPPGTPLT